MVTLTSRRCREKKLPREGLFFFPIDDTTSILPTNHIVGSEPAIKAGCMVYVTFEGTTYRAVVLKLSGEYSFVFLIGIVRTALAIQKITGYFVFLIKIIWSSFS